MSAITPEEIAALRKLAEAATPGPWTIDTYAEEWAQMRDVSLWAEGDVFLANIGTPECVVHDGGLANGRYIATANPQTILALLAELDAACNRITELETELKQCRSR